MATESLDFGQPLKYDPEFRGPIHRRSCTDCFCLLIFIIFIAGWAAVSFVAIRYGDPEQVLYPSDSYGRICGRNELQDKPYLYFFNILKCAKWKSLNSGCDTQQVCVESCPNYTVSFVDYRDWNVFKSLNDTSKRDLRKKLICNYNESKELSNASDEDVFGFLRDKKCGLVYFASEPLAGRCIPKALRTFKKIYILDEYFNTSLKDEEGQSINASMIRTASKGMSQLMNIRGIIDNIIQDLCKSWKIILVALIVAMIISFTWIILLQVIAGFMVWFSMLAILVLSSLGVYGCVRQYLYLSKLGPQENDEDLNDYGLDIDFTTIFRSNLDTYLNNKKTWLFLSIFCAIVNLLLLLTFIFLRKRVSIAISLIKEASKAIGYAKLTLLFPLVPYIFQFLVIVFGGFIAIMITASKKQTYRIYGDPRMKEKLGLPCNPFTYDGTMDNTNCTIYQYFSDEVLNYAHLYNLLLTFWVLFFIKGLCQMILAGAFAAYYWALDKPNDIPSFPLFSSTYRTLRYHTGSVAFGSLILSLVKLIRFVIEYIDQKSRKYPDNPFIKSVKWLFRCFFWCLEKFIKFLSTNAYIMIAIHGKSFMGSARDAFFLLFRNVLRVVVINRVADYLLLMGKLVVTVAMGLISFYYFNKGLPMNLEPVEAPDLNYSIVPVMAICIGTYFIAGSFFTVYDTAVDTIFLCFLEDCERNDGSYSKPYYMSKELLKILQYKNEPQNPF